MTSTILDEQFVSKVQAELSRLSENGPVTKKSLTQAVGITEEWSEVFTLMMKNGLLPGFVTKKGKFGGYVKTGFIKFGEETDDA